MPLDMSQPLHWDAEDVQKWLGSFKGKFQKLYGKKFADAQLTGASLLQLESANDLASTVGFGSKKKDQKDLRTIWQGISKLKDKTKENNYLSCPVSEWDATKFQAWLHSPDVDLGQHAERFKKVHSGDNFGALLESITDEELENKFLVSDPSERKTFFDQLEKVNVAFSASKGKGMLSSVFGGASKEAKDEDDGDSAAGSVRGRRERVRPKGVGKLQFGLGSLALGGFNTGGSEAQPRVRSTRDALDSGGSTDEDTPVRSARAAAPDAVEPRSGGVSSLALGPISFGDAKASNTNSRGGPKPKGIGGLSFADMAKNRSPRRDSRARRQSLSLLEDSDEEGQDYNLGGSDEEGDMFDEDAGPGQTGGKPRDKYSTGTFSDSGTFQLQGSHEINEYGILSNSAALQLRSYESKLEVRLAFVSEAVFDALGCATASPTTLCQPVCFAAPSTAFA